MRIPTLLAIIFLAAALALGVFLYRENQLLDQKRQQNFIPENIQISNISDSSVTVSWETKNLVRGSVIYAEKEFLNQRICNLLTTSCIRALKEAAFPSDNDLPQEASDIRGAGSNNVYLTHFIVLNKLKAGSEYHFRIKEDQFLFPPKALTFKTTKGSAEKTLPQKPLVGKVVDLSLKPIGEALVSLKIPQASLLTTISSSSGSFLIPLVNIYKEDLSTPINLTEKTFATLTIKKGNQKSEINISLPIANDRSLPTITLGENLDFSELTASSSAQIDNKFDLNNDGEINSLDLAIVANNFSRTPEDTRLDLNNDGAVNQKDADLIKKELNL